MILLLFVSDYDKDRFSGSWGLIGTDPVYHEGSATFDLMATFDQKE